MPAVLSGRTALVTGASRGIGAATARRLDREGARVALLGRDVAALEAVAGTLDHDPLVVPADLVEPDAPRAVVDRVLDAFGALDVLVNNAGAFTGSPAGAMTAADVDVLLAVNLRAPLLLAAFAGAAMAEAGRGSIVNVSSAVGDVGVPGTAAYSATKGGLDGGSRALAAELGPAGVRVNSVRPGIVRTSMTEAFFASREVLGFYESQLPLGRIAEADEVAEAVLFLASDASAYLTGAQLTVDGGWGSTGHIFPPAAAVAA